MTSAVLGVVWIRALESGLRAAGFDVRARDPWSMRVFTREETDVACSGCAINVATLTLDDLATLRETGTEVAPFAEQRALLKLGDRSTRWDVAQVGEPFFRIMEPEFRWRTGDAAGLILTANVAAALGLDTLSATSAAVLVDGVPVPLIGVVATNAASWSWAGGWRVHQGAYWPDRIGARAYVGAIGRTSGPFDGPDAMGPILVLRLDQVRRLANRRSDLRNELARILVLAAVTWLCALLASLWARGSHGLTARLRRSIAADSWLQSWRPYLLPGVVSVLVGGAVGAGIALGTSASPRVARMALVGGVAALTGFAAVVVGAIRWWGGYDAGRRGALVTHRTDDQSRSALLLATPLAICWVGAWVAVVVPLARQTAAYASLAAFAPEVVRTEFPEHYASDAPPRDDAIRWWGLGYPMGRLTTSLLGVLAPESFWSRLAGAHGRPDGRRIALTRSAWDIAGRPPIGTTLHMTADRIPGTLVAIVGAGLPLGLSWKDGSRLRPGHVAQAWIEQERISDNAPMMVAGPWDARTPRSALGTAAYAFPDYEAEWRAEAWRAWVAIAVQGVASLAALVALAALLITFAISQRARLIAVAWLSGAPPALTLRMILTRVAGPLALSAGIGAILWGVYADLLYAYQAVGDDATRGRAWAGIAGCVVLFAAACIAISRRRVAQLDHGRGAEWLRELVTEDE